MVLGGGDNKKKVIEWTRSSGVAYFVVRIALYKHVPKSTGFLPVEGFLGIRQSAGTQVSQGVTFPVREESNYMIIVWMNIQSLHQDETGEVGRIVVPAENIKVGQVSWFFGEVYTPKVN